MEAEIMTQKEAAEAAKREHELELTCLREGNLDDRSGDREDRPKAPKLSLFVDGKDDLDAYLQRFERFAKTATVPLETMGPFAAILPRLNRGFDLQFHPGKTPSNRIKNLGFT